MCIVASTVLQITVQTEHMKYLTRTVGSPIITFLDHKPNKIIALPK